MEPTLVVIGVSIRSAKLAVRERFLLDSAQISEALTTLVRSDAIDEIILLSNCNRTEFLVWTQDALEAANSVLRYLTTSSNLTLAEWSNFYRLIGDAAVAHVMRVTSGVDSSVFGEADATGSLLGAWQQAQRVSTTGRFLDGLMAKAFSTTGRLRRDLGEAVNMVTVAQASVAMCRQTLGDLRQRRILVLGAGRMALSAVHAFQNAGAGEITVVNRSFEHASQLARQCKVRAAHFESLWEQVLSADAVISAVSQKVLLTAEELEIVLRERKSAQLTIVDTSVPRTVDPNVRKLKGVTAFDMDDLCSAMDQLDERRLMLPVANRIIAEEAAGFHARQLSESMLPTMTGMRERLEIICDQERARLREQFGPFTEDQELALEALTSHITQRISAGLARQMKQLQARPEITTALQTLFEIESQSPQVEAKLLD